MATIRSIAQIAANRVQVERILSRQTIEAQRLERRRTEPVIYQRYDAETEQPIVSQAGVERPALHLLTNAGLSAGQPVEFQNGALDSTPRIRPVPAPEPVLAAPDVKWSLILEHRRLINGNMFWPELVYWEYSYTGQVTQLLVLPNRAIGTPSENDGYPYEILPALDERGLWLDAKTSTLVDPSNIGSDDSELTLYHTLNGQPVPQSESWRRSYANLPVMASLNPALDLPASYHPCIDLFQTQSSGPNINELALLLFSPLLEIGITGSTQSGGVLLGGQIEGSATIQISQLGTAEGGCRVESPAQTVQIELSPLPLERLGITRTDVAGSDNPKADTIRALTLMYFTDSL